MAITGVWAVAVIGLGPSGEAIINTFHYGPDGADVDVDPDLVASAFDGVLQADLRQLVTTDWHYLKTTVLCVHGVNVGKSGENADSAPNAGVLVGPSAPASVCAIGKRRCGVATRHNRGRSFFSPIPASTVNVDGKFTPPAGWVAQWAGLATEVVTPAATPFIPCLWDNVHKQAIATVANSVAPQIGLQRRRRLRQPN